MYLLTIILSLSIGVETTYLEKLTTSPEECTQLGEIYTDRINRNHDNLTAFFVCKQVGAQT